jgi:hypothetical protein
MRVPSIAFTLAAATSTAAAICSPVSVALAAPAPTLAGSWKGPFLSTNFIFEFSQAGAGWTGRYRSDKSGKWVPLQNISVVDGVLRFSFESQPPSSFTFKMDPAGKALNGTAKFGPHPPLPLTLTRSS